jgi:hypothetical protein
MTDEVKFVLDSSLYIPVFDYNTRDFENSINTLVLTGPIKWPPLFKEPNDFKTSLFILTVKYFQPGYL